MITWSDLLAELRNNLEDEGDVPKFSDKTLYTYLREAVADYSQFLPLSKYDVELVQDVGNPKQFALPADFVEETSVACPADHLLQPRQDRFGVRVATGSRPLFYIRDETSLYLNADPGDNAVILGYKAQHPVPADETDLTFVFTIPMMNIELVKIYVEARANVKIRNAQARLDRFKIGTGVRTDNPMRDEVEDFFLTYRQKLAERIPAKSVTLFRPRKYK